MKPEIYPLLDMSSILMPAQFSSNIGYDDIAADITGKYEIMFLVG